MGRLTGAENPFSKRSPDGPWDYIVIGSGMGGMSAAALLAKAGKRVLILEQHYVPGGFTHIFKRKGYTWDVGVHAIGEVSERSWIGRLLAELTDGELKWASLGEVYEQFHYPGDFRLDFPDNREQFIANLKEAFPDGHQAIDRYIELVKEVGRGMSGYLTARAMGPTLGPLVEKWTARTLTPWLRRTTAEVMAELTDDERLRTALTAQWGYYGSTPKNSAFAMHALVTRHFWHGGFYPIGGSEAIMRGLLPAVAEAGGWTRVACSVEQILIDNGRAVGVRVEGGEEIRADRVISAVGALPTVNRLLPPSEQQRRWAEDIAELNPAPAHVCLYMGFKGDISKAGASGANKWFYETWDTEDDTWHFEEPDSEAPVLYTSFPSMKDPLHDPGPDQRHTGEIVTFVPYESFERWEQEPWKRRGGEYDDLKSELSARLLKQLFKHVPELEPMLDYHELSTPVSTTFFTRAAKGSIYGLEPTPARFAVPWLRPRTPVKNLYLAGTDVGTVGVIGAFLGGLLCARAAEPKGVGGWLDSL